MARAAPGGPRKAEGIPVGYKRTEVGVIPEDWDRARVSDVARVKGGKRLPSGFVLVDTPTPYPYLRVTDMYPGGVTQADIKYVPEEAFLTIRNYRIYSDDIFISVAGTLGVVGVVPPSLSGANLTENADCITNIKCNRDYLMHWLMSPPIQEIIESIRTVGAQPKLALGRVAALDIAIPRDSDEQSEIAEALSDVDGWLGALDALLAKKRALKQATMQQLLTGKTRLPGFDRGGRRSDWPNLSRFATRRQFPRMCMVIRPAWNLTTSGRGADGCWATLPQETRHPQSTVSLSGTFFLGGCGHIFGSIGTRTRMAFVPPNFGR